MNKLSVAIYKDTTPAPWPSNFAKAELFTESMDTSFDYFGEDFPKQGLFNLETRKKLIHSVGAIMKIEYISYNNNYTGVFKGSKNAYLRFSVAQQVNTNGGMDAMAPGIALKFLRTNVRSANIFAMYSLIGQSSYNFFAHDLSSHVPDLPSDAPTALQLLRYKFSSSSNFPPLTGLTELANYDENGNSVPNLSFPFRLHFHPNSTLHFALPDNYTGVDWEDQVSKLIKPGQHAYDVYAQDTPTTDQLVLIGKIFAKSYPTTSKFSDQTLFFRHTRFETDLKTYPTWAGPANDIITKQRQFTGAGYHYPDMPW